MVDAPTSIQPRCRKCGVELGSSYLYSTNGFTYHHECFPASSSATRIAQLERELAEARELVAEANNSLYGSQSYFHSLNGGPFDKHHLSRGIEDLKERARKAFLIEAERDRLAAEVERKDAALRRLGEMKSFTKPRILCSPQFQEVEARAEFARAVLRALPDGGVE